MRPLVGMMVPAKMPVLVPLAIVCGYAVPPGRARDLACRVMVPREDDARVVLEAAAENAVPEVKEWHCVSARPLPARAYAEDPTFFWLLASRQPQSGQVVDLPEADPAVWDWTREAGVVHFAWPLVAVYEVRANREAPVVWGLGDPGRMALEEVFLRRANVAPREWEMFRAVIHRAGIPGALDNRTSVLLSRADPSHLASSPDLPRPLPAVLYEAASWPMYLPLGSVVRCEPTVSIAGAGPASEAARRRLRDLGWRVT
ncbi:MAG: hypothetical protein AB1816_05855 [Bacillota bacterium]